MAFEVTEQNAANPHCGLRENMPATQPFRVERLTKDVTAAYEKMQAQLLLIRVTLGLSPIHDPVIAVRTLFENGREDFEKQRGDVCEHAHNWKP